MEDFFSILGHTVDSAQKHIYTVRINPEHVVFGGHFPGKPIVPGVMTMMTVRQCADAAQNIRTRFENIKEIKYMQTIVPDGNPITISISLDGLSLQAEVVSHDGLQLMKIKGTRTLTA